MPGGYRAERHQRLLLNPAHCLSITLLQSFPRKREPKFQSRWLWVPAFAETTACKLNKGSRPRMLLRFIPRRSWRLRPPGPRFPDFGGSTRASPAACWRADRLRSEERRVGEEGGAQWTSERCG